MQALFPNVYSKMSVPKLLDGSSNTMSCSLYFRYPEMIFAIVLEQESTAVFSTGNVINKIERNIFLNDATADNKNYYFYKC